MGVRLSGQINRCQQAVTSVDIRRSTVPMHYLHDYMYLEQRDGASLAIMYIRSFLGLSTGSAGLIKFLDPWFKKHFLQYMLPQTAHYCFIAGWAFSHYSIQ